MSLNFVSIFLGRHHLQEKLFNTRYLNLERSHPEWDSERLFVETALMVSPVVNQDGSKNIPRHSTGGAVDIYLVDENFHPLEMGILVENWMTDIDGSLSRSDCNSISAEARHNRSIMAQAMKKVGFENYFAEYWHWSYGDRYWAFMQGHSAAFYSSI